jgi:hypothetical protein
MAESELGVLASQCLDRRIADKQILAHEVNAWQHHRNKHHAKANWQFKTADARVKLMGLYPQVGWLARLGSLDAQVSALKATEGQCRRLTPLQRLRTISHCSSRKNGVRAMAALFVNEHNITLSDALANIGELKGAVAQALKGIGFTDVINTSEVAGNRPGGVRYPAGRDVDPRQRTRRRPGAREPSAHNAVAVEKQGWDSIASRERYDLIKCRRGESAAADQQCTGTLLDDGRKSRRDLDVPQLNSFAPRVSNLGATRRSRSEGKRKALSASRNNSSPRAKYPASAKNLPCATSDCRQSPMPASNRRDWTQRWPRVECGRAAARHYLGYQHYPRIS